MARKSKNYTDDSKKEIVALKINGKSTAEISREYQVAKYNRNDEENELIRLRKEIKQLQSLQEIL